MAAKLQDYELEEMFKDFLDQCYEPIRLLGMEYAPSYALYELDPIAYREAYNNWLDTLDHCNECDEHPLDCKCIEGD